MEKHLDALLVGYLANAKDLLSEEQINAIYPGKLNTFLQLILETVPITELTDKNLIQHTLHDLGNELSVEETILHIFLLYMFKLVFFGGNHPLERGIIKQHINGMLPSFKLAFDKKLIQQESFERNVDALLHIAESTVEHLEIIEALKIEYYRYSTPTETN